MAGDTATAAGGTHPTGMHSCMAMFLFHVFVTRLLYGFIMLLHATEREQL